MLKRKLLCRRTMSECLESYWGMYFMKSDRNGNRGRNEFIFNEGSCRQNYHHFFSSTWQSSNSSSSRAITTENINLNTNDYQTNSTMKNIAENSQSQNQNINTIIADDEKTATLSTQQENPINPFVFNNRKSLRHLSEEEKEAILLDMEVNWKDHFPTLWSYPRKMNQLYDISTVDGFVKAQRILHIESNHIYEYKAWRYFSRSLTIILTVSIIYAYYAKIKEQDALIEKYYSQNSHLMKKALEHQKFEISDQEAEERLLLMEKKKEQQSTGTANLKKLRDRFDKSQLGEAKLFSVGIDYYAELERQAKLEAIEKQKREHGETPKPYVFYNDR
ncbi:hypothetical protein FDP41_000803 [Naegleria fowleri]|uniref:Transmembrane protein n=1 Tax=Naegleria fowleri TaxID=5763 RepID=A0A6A5CE90_NAEFO|nr:uncharacterized protein FDP41_000803 [Naegleria fowleri]KAF0984904.1 hypothetical protein FDP41_000803 [Naegleria fowleri]